MLFAELQKMDFLSIKMKYVECVWNLFKWMNQS
jgi:hypothetical protein